MAPLLVDLQHGTCGDAQPYSRPGFDQRFRAETLPAARRALALARAAGLEVIHTVIANFTADGRDRSLDYRRCAMGFPPGIRTLVVIGLLTDQCIDHTVKDAVDRGYRVVCLSDACQAETPERHVQALACFAGYAELLSVECFAVALQSAGMIDTVG